MAEKNRNMSDPHDPFLRDNEALWDARAPIRAQSDFYDVAGFRAGAVTTAQRMPRSNRSYG